jgi:glycosyltransferase involved in cell wall biosynthesis
LVQYTPKVIRYRKMIKLVRPDVVVGFMPSTFTYLSLAAIGTKVKVIPSIHNVPDRELGGDPNRWDQNLFDIWLRNKSLELSAALTVLLPSFVGQLKPELRPKTFVIPNMIKPHEGRPAIVGTDSKNNTILAVGRLAVAKDHETLIKAWAKIEPQYPAWRVKIFGRGPLRRDLHGLIKSLGLKRLTIEPPTTEIEAQYTSSKILAMPSIHEGFGLVTAEALACGLPVVGFADCEGTNEIVIDGENGLLVEPGGDRVAAFAAALARLIDDERLRIRLAGRAPESVQRFDPELVLDIWERAILDTHFGKVPS